MPLWHPRPVVIEPVITVDCWQILRLPDRTCHVMGRHSNGVEIRISRRIVALDLEPLRVRSMSGRVYVLSGPSARSRDDGYVLRGWCDVNGVERDQIEFVAPDALVDLPGLE